MGEPLMNFSALKTCVEVLADDECGLGMAKRRMTVSTSGVAPMIPRVASELQVRLALSLHAANDALRERLMGPVARQWSLGELQTALQEYLAIASDGKPPKLDLPYDFHRWWDRVSLEWVLLPGENDTAQDAREIAAFAKPLGLARLHVNVIPFNPWPGAPYRGASVDQARAFARLVEDQGLRTTVRVPRGRTILAACGQLKHEARQDVEM
jgi:23S rRNA (adenine2503-C2)-methyltransferase